MDDNWHVLVFETGGSYLGRDLTQVIPVGAHHEAAVAHAARIAAEYEPRHPMAPRSRRVFHIPPDSWAVQVRGTTRSFYFTVRVANLVSDQAG